jgi:Replication initiator protein A
MPRARRWQGQAPKASLLHPVWSPVTSGEPLDEAFVARCLLGAGWVGASRRLSMPDLRVWAALCALLRAQTLRQPIEDETEDLGHIASRTVETTGYQLAEMVFADDGGQKYRRLLRSLGRLASARVLLQLVEHDPELAAQRVTSGSVALIGDIWMATIRLDLRTPREWGALKGSTSLKVEIGHWTAQQVIAGRCTWLDLDLLRALGTGLPARLWAALEAWARWPQRSLDGREETAIGLGQPALQSLGVGEYAQARQARAALNRAGQKLVAVDPAYELVRCEHRGGGWCLVVRRVSGARARAETRKQGLHRDPGIAAKKQRRQAEKAERQVVRGIVRQELAELGGDTAGSEGLAA